MLMHSFPFQICDSFNDYLNDTVSKMSYPGQASVLVVSLGEGG